jgi:hypothetical protein
MITVVINNRDLLTWPRNMVEHIQHYVGLKEIIIFDNQSTYVPLLEWYKTGPCRVVNLTQNFGHKAPWTAIANSQILTDYYVVSDPDLDLAGVPRNVLLHLAALLQDYPEQGKVGLSLEVKDLTPDLPYYPVASRWEPSYWAAPLVDNVVRMAPIDTTFAMYSKALMNQHKICGARTERPYTARHLPWYVRKPDAEFQYYLDHAGESCSYKTEMAKRKGR